MNMQELLKGETGERANLEAVYKWVLEEMSYEDFSRLARLDFYNERAGYPFDYQYMVNRDDDSDKSREDYLKYLAYKLIQNLSTEGVELLN